MSLDTILAITAVALCIGQIAAARGVERRTTLLVGLPLGVIAIVVFSLVRNRIEEANHLHSLTVAEHEVIANTNMPATFDDIYTKVYYIPFDLANEAIDDLVSKHSLTSSQVMATDANGNVHTVRLFSNHP